MNQIPAIERSFPFVDEILEPYLPQLGEDYHKYKNHVYRMLHFCRALGELDEDDWKKCMIAASFHDLGIWTHKTVDYLPPSIELAERHLEKLGLQNWVSEILRMIDLHHKLRPLKAPEDRLVEIFRLADLVDVSLGILKSGVSASYIREVKKTFPNLGFHMRLTQLGIGQLFRDPLNPLPMFKW